MILLMMQTICGHEIIKFKNDWHVTGGMFIIIFLFIGSRGKRVGDDE